MSIRQALIFPLFATLLSACDVDFTGPGWIAPGSDWNPPGVDGSGSSTEIFEWRGQIAPGSTVEIKNINGDVRASSSADGTVRVVARKTGHKDDPSLVGIDVVETEDGVTLCAVYPAVPGRSPNECLQGMPSQLSSRNNDVSVTFEVEVPAGSDFVGGTIGGDVEAAGLDGDVVARSLGGDIDISTSGAAVGRTLEGDVTASIGRAVWEGDLEFSALNGNITVRIPEDTNAEVWGSTANGSIATDFPLTITQSSSAQRMHGTLGRGGGILTLTTNKGNISLRSN
jgi:hypothetical protein